MFNNYKDLGFNNPYYVTKGNQFVIDSSFDVISGRTDVLEIDETAIFEILNHGFMLGDRTIFKGIAKTPWLAKPNSFNNGWEYSSIAKRKELIASEEEVAKVFFKLLQHEIRENIAGKNTVGILLTGGMDSRVIAGTLDYVIKNEKLATQVVAITWGKNESRDVVYSRQIAGRFKWDWKHLTVSNEDMLKNIEIIAENGCEVSPIHLHAMHKVTSISGLDCILAGSFGDSVGRAEFSGKHISELKDFSKVKINAGYFLKNSVFKKIVLQNEIEKDISGYRKIYPQEKRYQQLELDYECHYMRRMLNPCMGIINKVIPLYQCFTKPYIYKFIWDLDPSLRNNNIYKNVIKQFKKDLSDIPWSRNGLPYCNINDQLKPDNWLKKHHDYGFMISNLIFKEVKELVLSDEINNLGIFNMDSLKKTLFLCHNHYIKNSIYYEERLIWLASLAKLLNKKDVNFNNTNSLLTGDKLRSYVLLPSIYLARKFAKKFKG